MAPWMGMTQFDPAMSLSFTTSDCSPMGCSQWAHRRDRFWSVSTMVGSTPDTDEPPISDDEGTANMDGEAAERGAVILEQGDRDDWSVADDVGQICGSFNATLDVEEHVTACGDSFDFQGSLSVTEDVHSVSEDVHSVGKPAVAWKKLVADEASEVEAAAAALSASNFPLLSAVQPRRRGVTL